MACRKLFDKFESIQSIEKESTSAEIDAVPTLVSKMKDPKRGTKRYFHADLTDGKKKIRLIGFNQQQQKQLEDFGLQQSPVKLTDCVVQKSTYSGNFEIKLTDQTKIQESPVKNFQIPESSSAEFSSISEVQEMRNYDKINLQIKVVKVQPPTRVPSGKEKQDLLVGDKTGCIKLTVWQEEVGKFETNHCYKLDHVAVRVYDDIKFISYPKDGATFAEIPDIGEVHTEYDETEFDSPNDFHKAVVSGVSRIFKYRSCLKCRSKIEPTTSCYGRCRSCNMLQNLDKVKETFSAVLMITKEDGKTVEMQAFERELRTIAQIEKDNLEEENLLEGKPFSFKVNQRDIITNVWR